jgi:cobalt-zinc-cadmium efflux system outer membrane protein
MTPITRAAIVGLALAAVWAGSARAQPPLTLEAAIGRILERDLAVEAARHRIDAARAERIGARVRPNPSLSVTAENLTLSGPTPAGDLYEITNSVSQPIELGGKRERRSALAEGAVALAEAQLTEVLQQRVAEVKRAFSETLLAREAVQHARALVAHVDEVVALNQARLEAGDIAEGELIKVRLERLKAEAAVSQAELGLRQAGIKLLGLLGETDFAPTGNIVGELGARRDVPALAALREEAQRQRPSVEVAARVAAVAERRIALERTRATPDPSPYLGFRRIGSDNTVVLGVTIPLPLFDRNEAAIARAEAEARAARAELERERTRVVADVESAYHAWQAAETQLARLEASLLPQARESRAIALAAYREGATGLLEYLEAERTLAEVQQQQARARFELDAARLTLELAVGRELGR